MQVGKRRSHWKYLWLVPLIYFLIAGFEAVIAGTVVGLMSVFPMLSPSVTLILIDMGIGLVLATSLVDSKCRPGFRSSGAGSMFSS